tara:strand:+ start:4505 stop:5083 length:579 start_codon:yes stop_codon:yes gene_type:complete
MGRQRIYYPEGSIQKGLYTEGGQWMTDDGDEWVGQYHRYTNTGEVYTQPVYVKDVSVKLVPLYRLDEQLAKNTFQYNVLKEVVEDYEQNLVVPDPHFFQPTQEDYDNSFATRYFYKRKGSTTINELSEDGFGELESVYYQKIELKWKIAGPLLDTSEEKGIIDTNRRTIMLYQNVFLGLERYLTDLQQGAKI